MDVEVGESSESTHHRRHFRGPHHRRASASWQQGSAQFIDPLQCPTARKEIQLIDGATSHRLSLSVA